MVAEGVTLLQLEVARMAWTAAEVFKYVKTMLGHPFRAVELKKENYEEALQRALRKAATWKPVFKLQPFTITQGVQKYDLSALGLNLPYGKGVTNLYDSPIERAQSVFSEFERYRIRQPPYVDMGELLMDQMYYKEIGNLTGTTFDWEWIPSATCIMVTPVPTRSRAAVYEYNAGAASIGDLSEADQGWVVDYTLALCKEMLGRVRGKFQGVSGNELPLNMDHDSLLSEAQSEQERLLEALDSKSRASWVPPIKG